MVSPRILILEDEEEWRNSHRLRLMDAGFDCYATRDAKDAIRAAKTDPGIKFVLLDEILYVTPFPLKEEERELQRWQGQGVIREIMAQRSDIQFIIISAAPQLKSDQQEGDSHVFRQETARLRRQQGVIDIVHKADIKEAPDETYGWIIDLLKRSQMTAKAEVVTPKILIGLGFSRETFEAIVEQMATPKRQFMPISPLLKQGGSRVLDEFWQRSDEKIVLLEMPGSKRLEILKEFKQNSSAFQILAFLALQSEKQANVLIQEKDYQHASRQSKKAFKVDIDADALERRDFAYEYGDNGRKGLRVGVQIEGKVEQSSPLKVAIHRLSQQLQKLNIGPARQLFNYEGNGYRPSFELGIVVYAIRSARNV